PDQLFARHLGVQKLLAVDVFTFDFDLQLIRVRNWAALEFNRYPRVSRRVARWIEEGHIYLQPFCRQAPRHSFTSASFATTPPNIRPFTRSLLKPSTPPPSQWPLNTVLNRFIPTTHPSRACPLCPTETTEDLQHFFFTCPLKFAVWRFINTIYLSHTPLSDEALLLLLEDIQTLSVPEPTRSASLSFPELTVYQIFATSLPCIWLTHWRTIFDHVPFVTVNVNTSISRSLVRLDSELQFDL
ncbi:hypothetical protein, partial, partial [Parasitella parasitica]